MEAEHGAAAAKKRMHVNVAVVSLGESAHRMVHLAFRFHAAFRFPRGSNAIKKMFNIAVVGHEDTGICWW
jgi:hypothetical protein